MTDERSKKRSFAIGFALFFVTAFIAGVLAGMFPSIDALLVKYPNGFAIVAGIVGAVSGVVSNFVLGAGKKLEKVQLELRFPKGAVITVVNPKSEKSLVDFIKKIEESRQ